MPAILPSTVRSCVAKKRYSTEEVAEKTRRRCENARGTPLRVYACDNCDGFHLARRDSMPPVHLPLPPRVAEEPAPAVRAEFGPLPQGSRDLEAEIARLEELRLITPIGARGPIRDRLSAAQIQLVRSRALEERYR